MMDNVRRVTEHLQSKRTAGHISLSLLPTRDGGQFHVDESGEYWRTYRFLEGARSYDSIPSVAHAREAAAEFGRFQDLLCDLTGPRLLETIPDFHNTPARYSQFHDALTGDAHTRAAHCTREIDLALAYETCAASLLALQEAGDIPETAEPPSHCWTEPLLPHAQQSEQSCCHQR